GPVVGVIGALEASLALALLRRGDSAAGRLYSYDALRGRLRQSRVRPRPDCPLCQGQVVDLKLSRYIPCSTPSTQETPCP
ncbi:MAG: hypothetical protein GXP55_09365, partial [Deltaproteobacteria bacterium]|nr:hypothetical protein [Deltaproteobacteria bacterium]